MSEFSNSGAAWINYYAYSAHGVHSLQVCADFSSIRNGAWNCNVTITAILLLQLHLSINDGTPPTADSYLTENGNMKLEVIGNSTTDWSLLCTDYPFIQNYTSIPYVFISVSFRDKTSNDVIEPVIMGWVEFINEVGFRACVGRPHNVEVPLDASIPYLEYLVISQDGIYDENVIDVFKNELFITLKLALPTDFLVKKFLNVLDENSYGFNYLLGEMIEGTEGKYYVNYGYMAHPNTSNEVYLFVAYDTEDMDITSDMLLKSFEASFGDGYFP